MTNELRISIHTKNAKESALEKKPELTAAEAKELLGWTEVEAGMDKHLILDKKRIYLANNLENRPFRTGLAKRYALEMLRKKWGFNGETIIIDSDGNIASGAHRLVGLIIAEQSRKDDDSWQTEYGWDRPVKLPCMIVYGMDPNLADTLDTGISRSAGDVLFRRNLFDVETEKEAKWLSSALGGAVRLVWLRSGGKNVSDAPHFPHSEMLDFIEYHPELLKAAQEVYQRDEDKALSRQLSKGYATALLYLCACSEHKKDGNYVVSGKSWGTALEFVDQLASGEDLKKGDPVYELREYYSAILALGRTRDRDMEVIGPFIKAWNHFSNGKAKIKRNDVKVLKDEVPTIGGLDSLQDSHDVEE